MLTREIYDAYTNILLEEMIPALGCTEPIAVAYASAVARRTLGHIPERIIAQCSGNIIKNVKSVIVPNSGGMKGIEAAAVLGAVGGNCDKCLEALSEVTEEDQKQTRAFLENGLCKVKLLQSDSTLHIIITALYQDQSAYVEIRDSHTEIVCVKKNDAVLFQKERCQAEEEESQADRRLLNVRDILEYADTVDLKRLSDVIAMEVEYNTGIAKEGLSGTYGANVGKTLLETYGDDIKIRARATAAAGSDARMSGCSLPVVINSGSGNQGMTVSLPVIEYAKELQCSKEKMYRALIVSNLVAIHQKKEIGKLSAYCGAVNAACGSGAAITYLYGGTYGQICQTITNTLANVSGIVCDGAKPSCAAKIASAIDAAILAHSMTFAENSFHAGDGMVKDSVEKTIKSVGRLARDGMRETDQEILKIMIDEE